MEATARDGRVLECSESADKSADRHFLGNQGVTTIRIGGIADQQAAAVVDAAHDCFLDPGLARRVGGLH